MKSFVSTVVDWFKAQLFCEHDWTNTKVVDDYDLRAGYRHKSIVKTCRHCGRSRTFTEIAQ